MIQFYYSVKSNPFRIKSPKVHTFSRVFLLQLVQVRQDVYAVDAAVSEEVKQHHFARQLLVQRQRPLCVQPFQAWSKSQSGK